MVRYISSLFFLSLFFFIGDPAYSQKVVIDQIVKENEDGEIRACGIEVAITDGNARGLQMQAIIYSRGNLNWDADIFIISGTLDEDHQFEQEPIESASILLDDFGEIFVILRNKYVLKKFVETTRPDFLVSEMLEKGFSVSYKTKEKPDGFIEIASSKEAYENYTQNCYNEMVGMQREHYREIHGDTKCIDNPSEC